MLTDSKKDEPRFSLVTDEKILVPKAGLEPAHPLGRRILNPLRLPIPPLRHFEASRQAALVGAAHYSDLSPLVNDLCAELR